jgi:hypothetical protein
MVDIETSGRIAHGSFYLENGALYEVCTAKAGIENHLAYA